ncbi:MAG: histidinol dehydrogenase, partial [Actinobacteria bacterium]|nr:histidinol dehydrogenase [Actinomycetota bacterium]
MGSAPPVEGGRRVLDPRPAGRAARSVRGRGLEDVLPRVAEIVADVRERGDAALLDWSERLDGERPELRVSAERLDAARLDEDVLAAVRAMARAVADFCAPQRPPDTELEAVRG